MWFAMSALTFLRHLSFIGSRSIFSPSHSLLESVWPANTSPGPQAQTNYHSPVSPLRCSIQHNFLRRPAYRIWTVHGLSPSGFRKLINYANTPCAKKGLPAEILAGIDTTHTWHSGILPERVESALAETSNWLKPEDLAPKDFVGVLNCTLPAEPTNPPIENLLDCWNGILGAYLCPRVLKCWKKFASASGLRDHLESITHDKKAFR